MALEQAIGAQQSFSASCVGSTGQRLIQSAVVSQPNPAFNSAYLVTKAATSDYHALQLQFHRQLRQGLQALASYTWAHSIDTASAGSSYVGSNTFVPGALARKSERDLGVILAVVHLGLKNSRRGSTAIKERFRPLTN